jgi:hypothetical protein
VEQLEQRRLDWEAAQRERHGSAAADDPARLILQERALT